MIVWTVIKNLILTFNTVLLILLGLTLTTVLYASPSLVEISEQDLSPLSLGPNSAQVVSLIEDRQWFRASRLIKGDDHHHRFLRAWLLVKAEKWEDALRITRQLDQDPIFGEQIQVLHATAALELKQFDEAASVASQVSDADPNLFSEVLRIRGQALRELKQWDQAKHVYERLLSHDNDQDQAIGRLGLGLCARDQGQYQIALRYFTSVDVRSPGRWTATQARREAKAIIQAHPELAAIWKQRSLADQVLRIEELSKKGLFESALNAAQALIPEERLSPPMRCTLHFVKGRSLDKLRKRAAAYKALKQTVSLCSKIGHTHTPTALYLAGRAARRVDDTDGMLKHFTDLFQTHQHRLSDDAGVFLIQHWIAQENGLDQAVAVARQLPKLHPNGDLSSEGIIFTMVAAWRAQRFDIARELVNLLFTLPPKAFTHHDGGRHLYWDGRLLAKEGKIDQAQQRYQEVIHSAPMSWHALLAYSRLYEYSPSKAQQILDEAIQWKPKALGLPSSQSPNWTWSIPKDRYWSLLQRAFMWGRLGMKDFARRSLVRLSELKVRPDIQWLSAWALDQLGLHHWSHDILRRKLTEYRHFPPSYNYKKHWLLSFPNPFSTLVHRAGESEGVPKTFIWGIMREESGFAPRIRSSANAVGLLQLIVNTAKMMRRSDEPEVTIDRLGLPAVNIPLGARYLAYVQRRINCQWSLVPAGYNAGGGALRRWLNDRGDLDLDLFVETIPYEEARWYLKRVNSSWITYRTLYGAPKGEPIWPYIPQNTRISQQDNTKKANTDKVNSEKSGKKSK